MSKIVNLKGEEINRIPEEHIAGIFVHLTGAIHCLIANHGVFQNLLEQCKEISDEDLQRIIKENSEDLFDATHIEALAKELRSLMKIYAHISPILSLYNKNIITEAPKETLFVSENNTVH